MTLQHLAAGTVARVHDANTSGSWSRDLRECSIENVDEIAVYSVEASKTERALALARDQNPPSKGRDTRDQRRHHRAHVDGSDLSSAMEASS